MRLCEFDMERVCVHVRFGEREKERERERGRESERDRLNVCVCMNVISFSAKNLSYRKLV